MTVLRAGIIGLGVGEQHIAGYERHPACRVTALCDFDAERLARARATYTGRRCTPDADEILDDPEIDVVSIASFDNYHHAQVLKAIERGKHVFVEKPLCLHRWEAEEIHAALRARPEVRLSSNLVLRGSPRFRWLKTEIERGTLGRVYYLEGDYAYGRLHKITEGWRGRIDGYSGVHGGGVHVVDLLLWLTGGRVTEVAAVGTDLASRESGFGNFDLVASLLRFEDGAVGKVTVNLGCVHPHFHPLAVYGTTATFVNGLDGGLLYTSSDPSRPPHPVTAAYPGVAKGELLYAFVEAVLCGTALPVPTDQVFATMAVCLAIEEAAHAGGWVPVHYFASTE